MNLFPSFFGLPTLKATRAYRKRVSLFFASLELELELPSFGFYLRCYSKRGHLRGGVLRPAFCYYLAHFIVQCCLAYFNSELREGRKDFQRGPR